MIMLISIAAGLPLPLLPLQLLWLNLVTDGISGLALAAEKPHKTTLTTPPRKKSDGILSKKNLIFILSIAGVMVAFTLWMFVWWLERDLVYARTVAFIFLVVTQIYNMINLRSLDMSIMRIGFFSNKAITLSVVISMALLLVIIEVESMRNIFGFAAVSPMMFISLVMISSVVFFAGELLKKAHTVD